MSYQTTVDKIAQTELSEYLVTGDIGFYFQSLNQATSTILEHAFELATCKQRLSRKEYKQLLQEQGWQGEEKTYLKVATTFDKFSLQDLTNIEPDTIFRLAKNNKKYQDVIEKLSELPQITQEDVRELIKQQRRELQQPKPEKLSIWRRTKNGGRYCQIPPIHEEDERTGVTLQRMIDEEGLLPQQIVAEAISLRQAFKEGRLIMVTDASSTQSDNADSGDADSPNAYSDDINTETYTDITELNHPQLPNTDEKEAIACIVEHQQHVIDEKETVNIDVVISLLRQADNWEEVVRSTENCSNEVKIATWEMLNPQDKERIYQLKQQQEQRLKNMPQVGDKVIWTNCHPHLSSWQPFVFKGRQAP
ncbi:hypothetical protein [Calothrix sp. 336/3]|uniref:hypothetical protein n=1 Tax=Calothrix sp. 336/3 TaxID=1337936 RepID=UPI000A3EC14D